VPRVTGLTQMRTLLNAWRVRRGYAFDRPRSEWPHGQRETGAREMHDCNEQWERAGPPAVVSANIIALDVAQPARPFGRTRSMSERTCSAHGFVDIVSGDRRRT
jgi:hypothetical protein